MPLGCCSRARTRPHSTWCDRHRPETCRAPDSRTRNLTANLKCLLWGSLNPKPLLPLAFKEQHEAKSHADLENLRRTPNPHCQVLTLSSAHSDLASRRRSPWSWCWGSSRRRRRSPPRHCTASPTAPGSNRGSCASQESARVVNEFSSSK